MASVEQAAAARHRLFFALWPDAAVRRRLQTMQDALPRHGGRLTRAADLHITLVFLGESDAGQLACARRLAAGVAFTPFSLRIDRLGYWPRPRVAWAAPAVVPEVLPEFVARLGRRLETCGYRRERRAYKPHVTLARKARAVRHARLDTPLVWACRHFVLVESAAGVAGTRYRVIESFSPGS